LLSGRKVSTSSSRRKVERRGAGEVSMRSTWRWPSQACQMRALDMAPLLEETTKVPT
jgi:hypothetical protein